MYTFRFLRVCKIVNSTLLHHSSMIVLPIDTNALTAVASIIILLGLHAHSREKIYSCVLFLLTTLSMSFINHTSPMLK